MASRKILQLQLLLLCLPPFGALAASSPCVGPQVQETIQDYQSTTQTVFAPTGRKTLRIDDFLGDKRGVILGIGKEGHFYLTAGSLRLESGFFPFPGPVTRKSASISEGYLIHFPDVPQEQIGAWAESMSAIQPSDVLAVSCVRTACLALRKGFDIRIAGEKSTELFLAPTLDRILRNGFVDSQGSPIPFELIQTSRRTSPLKGIRSSFQIKDVSYTLVASLISLKGGQLILFIAKDLIFDDEPKPRPTSSPAIGPKALTF